MGQIAFGDEVAEVVFEAVLREQRGDGLGVGDLAKAPPVGAVIGAIALDQWSDTDQESLEVAIVMASCEQGQTVEVRIDESKGFGEGLCTGLGRGVAEGAEASAECVELREEAEVEAGADGRRAIAEPEDRRRVDGEDVETVDALDPRCEVRGQGVGVPWEGDVIDAGPFTDREPQKLTEAINQVGS